MVAVFVYWTTNHHLEFIGSKTDYEGGNCEVSVALQPKIMSKSVFYGAGRGSIMLRENISGPVILGFSGNTCWLILTLDIRILWEHYAESCSTQLSRVY